MAAKCSFLLLVMTSAVFGLTSSPQNPAPAKPDAPPRVDQYGDPLPPAVLARCGSCRLRPGKVPGTPGETSGSMFFTPDKKQLITCSSGILGRSGHIFFW